ncbi:sigma-54 dependent transcriptional regulator [Myxococcota bacterium]|nr:sigma-54 dependent transcriptional regulator [Myxococcota bacterium]
MTSPRILIVDDEQLIRWTLKERLAVAGYRTVEASSGQEALERLDGDVDLVLLDYKLPDVDGITLLRQLKERDPELVVVLITAYSSLESGIEAIKQGAYHYMSKPFNFEEVLLVLGKALETTRLRREVKALRASRRGEYTFERIVGDSPATKAMRQLVERVATSPAMTVLLVGESGTGKDLAAKVIHYNSSRTQRPFVTVTCSGVPEHQLEQELFGVEPGHGGEGKAEVRGVLARADGGTVVLDAISELTPGLQAKLVRLFEERAFKRVGGVDDVRVDVRIIATTSQDLGEAVKKGLFRADLHSLLDIMPIAVPSLRERRGDLRPLVQLYVDTYNRDFKKNVRGVSADALTALERYDWPGNIRELRNTVERAMLLADSDELSAASLLPLGTRETIKNGFRLPDDGIDFEELERDLVRQALARTGGNQTRAAALLGMNRDQIRYRIEKFELARPSRTTSAPAEPSRGPATGA